MRHRDLKLLGVRYSQEKIIASIETYVFAASRRKHQVSYSHAHVFIYGIRLISKTITPIFQWKKTKTLKFRPLLNPELVSLELKFSCMCNRLFSLRPLLIMPVNVLCRTVENVTAQVHVWSRTPECGPV